MAHHQRHHGSTSPVTPEVGWTKPQWRAWARTKRHPDPEESARAVSAVAELVQNTTGWVIVYDPLPDEIDPSGLIEVLGRDRVGITRTPSDGLHLSLHPYDAPREQHPFGYTQPAASSPVIADADVAAIVIPALAYDREGFRLGRGKGYYDVTLARLGLGALRIGVVGADRIADAIPHEPHDQPVSVVCAPDVLADLR